MPSVTRTTQSNRSKRRDEIRAQLLVAVERLLAEGQGFTELSVERLATEAGVSRSTFYVYFEDKADLLRAWLASIISEVYQAAKAWWDLPDPVTKEDLRDALGHIVATYRPHTTLMSAVLDASAYDGGVREDFDRFMQRNIAGLRAHITDGQATGTIDSTLLAKETASWLTWMAERGLHIMVAAAGDAELRRLITAYTDVIWNTLYAPAARATRG